MPSYLPPTIACFILVSLIIIIAPVRKQIHSFTSLLVLCAVTLVWHGSWAIMFIIDTYESARDIAIIGHLGILFIPFALNNLYESIFGSARSYSKYLLLVYILSLPLLFSGLIIEDVVRYEWGFYPKAGVLHPLYLGVVFAVVIFNFIKGLKKARSTTDPMRSKSVLYATLACGIYSLAAYDYLLNYQLVATYPWGFLATIAFIIVMTSGMINFDLLKKKSQREKLSQGVRVLESAVSEKDRNLLELRAAIIQKEKLASIGLVSNGVAHQLGNTINVISTARKALRGQIDSDNFNKEKSRKLVDSIANAVELSKSIIDSINSTGRENDVYQMNSLSSMVDSGIVLTKGKSLEKVRMINNCDPSLEIYCSKSSVIQVLMCLMSNAVDAMDYGGRIWIESEESENSVTLKIKDEGSGIPEGIRESLFEPFATTKSPDEGTGLGMYLAKKEMNKNNGTISFDTSSKGTTFYLSFPKRLESAS